MCIFVLIYLMNFTMKFSYTPIYHILVISNVWFGTDAQTIFSQMGTQITSIVFPPMRSELKKLNWSTYPLSRILSPFDTNFYFSEFFIFLTYVWVNLELEVIEMCVLFWFKGFPLLKVKELVKSEKVKSLFMKPSSQRCPRFLKVKEFVKSEKVKCFIMKPSSHRFPTATLRSTTSWISAGFLSQRFQILLGNNFAGLS